MSGVAGYVVLHSVNGTLAVFRVRLSGALRRLSRVFEACVPAPKGRPAGGAPLRQAWTYVSELARTKKRGGEIRPLSEVLVVVNQGVGSA